MRFNIEKVEGARNFANKLWNASRFVLMNLGHQASELDGRLRSELEKDVARSPEPADRWIASRYRSVAAAASRLLEAFELGEAARTLYEFTWSEFCDWYIEMVKSRLYGDDEESGRLARLTLAYVLDGILRLLHPFMPFVTEEIWQRLSALEGDTQTEAGGNALPETAGRPRTIVLAPWPSPAGDLRDEVLEDQVSLVIDVVRSIRNLRAEMNVPPGKKSPVILVAESDRVHSALEAGASFIRNLAHVAELEVTRVLAERPRQAAAAGTRGVEVFLPLRGLVDLSREADRLAAELETARHDLFRIRGKLENQEFVNKAPAAVVERERGRAGELELKCGRLAERLTWLREEVPG